MISPEPKRILAVLLLFLTTSCQQEDSGDALARQAYLDARADTLATFIPCARSANTPLAALVVESRCSTYNVPENYDDPEGRHIDLRVMVIPSLTDLPLGDPLFLLAGGPGQAATDLLPIAQAFGRVRTERDIVLVDQRGTGELSPFDCQLDESEAEALQEQDPGFEEILAIQLEVLRECLDTMDADPAYYTTDIAMRDLDAIRDWIGYPEINLWGASYGSRAALAYLQAYPGKTRAVIIDAIAPPSLSLPLYNERDASASLQQILDDCAADTTCSTAFPDLAAHYTALIEHLQMPQPVSMLDDRDFSTVETTIEAYEFFNFIRQILYSREAQRLVPLIIEQAWQGNYRPVFALASQYAEAQINQGMFLSVICNEDYTLLDANLLAAEQGRDYLVESDLFNRFILEACAIWPGREVPVGYFEPVTADRPVLVFSGALDPVTPPVWGELVSANLPNSQHLVLEGFGHGTVFTGCTISLMTDFIEAGSLAGLDTGCVGQFRRRPFFVTPGGSSLPDD